jgi:hypothetical protein
MQGRFGGESTLSRIPPRSIADSDSHELVYWGPAEKMPLDLFSYLRKAGLCFGVARFLATIVFSSTAVELVLNRDRRTKRHPRLRRIGGWATLNKANLAVAAGEGLPVRVLLSDEESLENEKPVRADWGQIGFGRSDKPLIDFRSSSMT